MGAFKGEAIANGERIERAGSHMLREILEQPEAIRQTVRQHWEGVSDGIRFDRSSIPVEYIAACNRILIAASGASRHAALYGQAAIEQFAGIPVQVEFSSEYCNRPPAPGNGAIAIFISQSGETGDTKAALLRAKEAGYKTIAITNVVGSTIAAQADAVMYTYAGRELAIPATKSFLCQLASVYLVALLLGASNGRCAETDVFREVSRLADAADLLEGAMPQIEHSAQRIATEFQNIHDWVLLGRGVHYAVALEGALKLKETAYLRAEAFPAGEFRHGPQAILDGSQVVVGVVGHDSTDKASQSRYRKTLGVLNEIAPFSGPLVLIAIPNDLAAKKRTGNLMCVPETSEFMLALLETVALQTLAYNLAKLRGLDVDRPRNLVKSVEAD